MVTIQHTPLSLHGGVAVVLESSRMRIRSGSVLLSPSPEGK
ncbi:MAG: hypothetical protein ACE5FZ_03755 [Nitrospiria bacterium]